MDRASTQAIRKVAEPSESSSVAELTVAYLEQLGIEYVFGIPGGAVEPFYNALAESARRGGPRHVTARHEAGAAFMADGYARETGKIGVCLATSGPGATNLITGIACSYDNGVPVLAITGQPPLPTFGRQALQESGCTGVNIVGMFRHCTRYNSLVSHASQAETKVVSAIARALQMNGPVHLSLPVDVQRTPVGKMSHGYPLSNLLTRPALVDEFAVQQLQEELARARQPILLIGGGCGDAAPLVMAIAERLGARFLATPDGKGLIDPQHPLYRGVFGFAGHASARELLHASRDLVVAVGTSLGEWASGGWSSALLNERLIHVDTSEDNLIRSPMARLHVRGNIRTVFERLLRHFPASTTALPTERPSIEQEPRSPSAQQRVAPQALMHRLSQRAPVSTRFFADTGNSTAWAVHCLDIQGRRAQTQPLPGTANADAPYATHGSQSAWLRVTMDFAPMGWAIGAAIGAAFADPRHPVVCLTGDGSYLMNGQEISVAQSAGLPVIFVVLNDAALGMVMHGQRLAGAEPIGFELPQVDFSLMAKAFGIHAEVIQNEEDLQRLDFEALFARRGPTLLDVRIDAEQVPPMSVRMKVLGATQ